MNRCRTFLVVDDDVDARFLMRHAVEKAFPGTRVIECDTIDAALEAADECSLDGVITDHQLGEEDGATLVRELRIRGVGCPIVMVTSSCDPQVIQRAYEAGAAHVFADGEYDFIGFFQATADC